MAISASGEGCHKQMEPFLPQVMDGVLNYIQDPHPRYAWCVFHFMETFNYLLGYVLKLHFLIRSLTSLWPLMSVESQIAPHLLIRPYMLLSEHLFFEVHINAKLFQGPIRLLQRHRSNVDRLCARLWEEVSRPCNPRPPYAHGRYGQPARAGARRGCPRQLQVGKFNNCQIGKNGIIFKWEKLKIQVLFLFSILFSKQWSIQSAKSRMENILLTNEKLYKLQ